MKKTVLILVVIFYSNHQCQDYSLSLFATYYPNVTETRKTQTSYNLNSFGVKFIVDSFLPYRFISGIELRYGSKSISTLVMAPIIDVFSGPPAYIGSDRDLTFISTAVPVMYKINVNLIAQVNIGVYIRYSYFQIIDNITRYPARSVVNYGKSFTLYDDDWSVIPAIEINSNINESFFVFLGIEYNYNKSNFQISTDSENLNNFVYYQTYRTVMELGDNLEYDYRGIGITLGLTYKI